MRLTRYTDYAFRVLFYLGVNSDRAVPISEMARSYDISQNHLMKVVHELVKSGYLESVRGRSGGVLLARPAVQITLGDVIRQTEPDMQLVDCTTCLIAPVCTLPKPLAEARRAFIDVLDRYTLADVVDGSVGLEALVGRH